MNIRDPSEPTAGFVASVLAAPLARPAEITAVASRFDGHCRTAEERVERNGQIKRLRMTGMTLAKIGEMFDLTESGVHHVISGRRG